jgi:DNA-binding NarL/FixJ family response regulator
VTTVLVADDQALVRAGFRMILESADLVVVAEASDGDEAVALATEHRPDVALLDVRMPGTDGIEATRRIVAAELPTKVLILTTFDLDEYVYDGLQAGASGFLLKDVPRDELVHAVHVVARGDGLLAPTVTRRLIEDIARRPRPADRSPARLDVLTAKEREVLELVARGLANGEIAEALYVSEATVKTHFGHVLTKLHLRDRVQAVILAYEVGLVRPGS